MTKKILVIDDDEGILEGFQAVFENEGYTVIISRNGNDLKLLSKKDYPDIILLDVLLSGLDGRDLCLRLKEDQNTKQIPIIMMSAAPKMEKSVKKAKADGYLRKPFEIEQMLSLITKHTAAA
jgi:DNA-binding response OmpR family regulator